MADIDGLSTYPGGTAAGGHSEGGVTALEESLRIRPTWINGAGETPGQGGSVVAAMLAVAAGLCRHVLCFRTVWESTWAERVGRRPPPSPSRVEGDFMSWRAPYGALSAANWIAMNASNHFHRYGTTRAALGTIAVNARRNAGLNPHAIYRAPMTMDDYFAARMISSPFGLYDCDVPCDGSIALVVSAIDTALDLRHPPVFVEAVGTQVIDRISWDQGALSHEPQTQGPAAHLWTRTSLKPEDVDVAELYDGFTFNCLSWIEALGFCGIGEAGDFLSDPGRIALDGELPLNTFGGQLSAGRTHGYGFLHEAVVQLRGDGNERQVAGARVAVVSTGGGTPGGCFLFTNVR
jgi:acetyl-CoA acetyltransferase